MAYICILLYLVSDAEERTEALYDEVPLWREGKCVCRGFFVFLSQIISRKIVTFYKALDNDTSHVLSNLGVKETLGLCRRLAAFIFASRPSKRHQLPCVRNGKGGPQPPCIQQGDSKPAHGEIWRGLLTYSPALSIEYLVSAEVFLSVCENRVAPSCLRVVCLVLG